MTTKLNPRITFSLLSLCLIAIACQSDLDDLDTPPAEVPGPLVFPTGEVMEIVVNDQLIPVVKVEGRYVAGGDMIVDPDNERGVRKIDGRLAGGGIDPDGRSPGLLWPSNTIPYTIHPELGERDQQLSRSDVETVQAAIAHIEENTNLQFVERTNQKDYVTFYPAGRSWSHVGRVGGEQFVELLQGVPFRTAVHEICHALGMYHEHTRPDRDEYITFYPENLSSQGGASNFFKFSSSIGKVYTRELDFASVMLYGSYTGAPYERIDDRIVPSDSSKPVMTKLNGEIFEESQQLSAGDIATLNEMYPPEGTPPINNGPTVSDISGHWAEDEISYMVSNRLMAGYTDGTFRPDRELSRAEFAVMIRYTINPAPSSDPAIANRTFSDILEDQYSWARQAILDVARAGYMAGYGEGLFGPDRKITRAEVITALANGLGLSGGTEATLTVFSDRGTIPPWAVAPVANATYQGFVANYPTPSVLNPTRNATRAEAVVTLYQALRYLELAPALANQYLVNPPS